MTGALTETAVRPNVLVWTLGGETMRTSYGANCTGVLGADAVLLVDPLIAPAHARLVDEGLRRHTNAPVRLVVLTHHHTDHALGAAWFARQGATVITQRACREAMEAEHPAIIEARRRNPEVADLFADAAPVVPAVTFEESLTLHVGGVEVEVWHAGWGHTEGDLFLYLPAERVAVCGDLLWHGYHFNYEDASVRGVRAGLQALRALDADTFVPGHGAPGGPDLLDEQGAYHDAVETVIREGAETGRDDSALGATLRARFPNYRLELVLPTAIARFKS